MSEPSTNEQRARAESAEAALAAARAENERLRVEMEQHMQVAASRCSRLLDTEAALEAAREAYEQLEEVITSTAVALGVDKVETNDPHCLAHEIAHQLAALRADLENKLAAARAAPSPPPETEWTSTPPTEPGWYWRRRQIRFPETSRQDDIYGAPYVVRVYSKGGALWDDFGEIPSDGDDFLQWWPVPIAPPRREP
jgi:hypothetical protein